MGKNASKALQCLALAKCDQSDADTQPLLNAFSHQVSKVQLWRFAIFAAGCLEAKGCVDWKMGGRLASVGIRCATLVCPRKIVDPMGARRYACNMDITRQITIEPGKRGGQPCIRGMRITVRDVSEYLAGGMRVEEVLRDFPELTIDDIHACLTYAANQLPRPAA
jgi:uncharacterized protein (DUF433 family)